MVFSIFGNTLFRFLQIRAKKHRNKPRVREDDRRYFHRRWPQVVWYADQTRSPTLWFCMSHRECHCCIGSVKECWTGTADKSSCPHDIEAQVPAYASRMRIYWQCANSAVSLRSLHFTLCSDTAVLCNARRLLIFVWLSYISQDMGKVNQQSSSVNHLSTSRTSIISR